MGTDDSCVEAEKRTGPGWLLLERVGMKRSLKHNSIKEAWHP